MKTSTLGRPTETKQNRTVRLFGRLLLKLLAVTATFGATCACLIIPHFTLLSAGIEGSLYWLILVPSVIVGLAVILFVGWRIDAVASARRGKAESAE
jgi:hypothetical protein